KNTNQLRWMALLYANLILHFRARSDVFVGTTLLWYPEEGHPEVRTAPDVLVVFGRPNGKRGSYKQWEEDGIPLTVVFDILSPSKTVAVLQEKHAFYEKHAVEEYYVYDPDNNRLLGFVRRGKVLRPLRQVNGFTSPRLSVRFKLSGGE